MTVLWFSAGILLCASGLFAGEGTYVKRFYGFDNFLSGSPAQDGGYLAALELNWDELYLGDTALIRLNPDGSVRWKRILSNNLKDHIYDSVEMADGGWVAVGDTYECPMSRLCYAHPVILRLDPSGAVLWQKTLNTVELGGDCCSSVIRFGDGVLVAGSLPVNLVDDILLVALDAGGDLLWAKTYGGSGIERPEALVPSCDGGALVFGDTETGSANDDLFAMKVDGRGAVVWSRRYHSPEFDYVMDAAPSGCSSYVGALSGGLGVVMRLNPDGKPVWRRSIRVFPKPILIRAVEAEDGVLVAGGDRSAGVIVKLDLSGRLLWAKQLENGGLGEFESVSRNGLGGFNLAGPFYGPGREAMVISHLDAAGQTGNCRLLAPVGATSTAVSLRPFTFRLSTASAGLTVSDLVMHYRNRGFESSVCR